jgi:LacI family transcriptional regulator
MLDVAKLAGGVHPSTVSLVLRNSPNISEATRKRVLEAVRKVGYRRDPLLDAYNHHRMGVIPHKTEPIIACVSDLDSRDEAEHQEPYRSFLKGARAAAENLHSRLELFLTGKNQLSPERLNGILHARGISSILIMALRSGPGRLAFTWEDYSAVRIESPRLPQPRLAVSTDQRQSARLGLRSLLEAGYMRIGLLLRPGTSLANRDLLLAGHLLEQSLLPPGARIPPLLLPATGEHRNLVRDWIHQHRIEAVLAESPALAALMPPATEPHAPGFAVLDVSGAPAELAGIMPDHERVGAQAVEQLVSLMRANQRGPAPTESCTYVPVRWRPGSSAPGFGPRG